MSLHPRWPRTVLTVLVCLQMLGATALAAGGGLLALESSNDSASNPWAGLGVALGVVATVVGLGLAATMLGALLAYRRGSTVGPVLLLVVEVLLFLVGLAVSPALGTWFVQPALVLVVGATIVLAAYETRQLGPVSPSRP